MYAQRKIEALSCNHCFSGRAVIITYSECVFVVLGVQRATHMRHVVICGVFYSTIFFPLYFMKGMVFEKQSYLM